MRLNHPAVAGSLESSDILITVSPNEGRGLDLRLESIVMMQFGEAIFDTVRETLASCDVSDAVVDIVDKGALDWVIRSRMQAAIYRAADKSFDWQRTAAP